MSSELVCVGLSHKTAPVELRERLALSDLALADVHARIGQGESELMVLSTCNRVEFYATAPLAEAMVSRLREEAAGLIGADAGAHLYEHRGEAALVHLFRVAASLDSMVVGEPQILGQMKDAFETAQIHGSLRAELAKVCSAAFGSAKRVRSETGVGRSATSMASAAVALASKIFGGLEGKSVLLVGAGEMAELAGRHLAQAGAREMTLVNRTYPRAVALAAELGAQAAPFEDLFRLLEQVDVVVCTTASPRHIFTRENVHAVLKPRKHRPLFMVDLAVPRDIAPEVNTLEGVYAYDVDDIQKVVAENSAQRSQEAAKAEVIVAEEVARFVKARAVREGVPVLAQLRQRAEQIARAEAERTVSALGDALNEKQRKSVEAMAFAIVNKLLHQPTAKLRAVHSDEEDRARLADAAAELFGLEAKDESGGAKTGSHKG